MSDIVRVIHDKLCIAWEMRDIANVGSMLCQRRRLWPNIDQALEHCVCRTCKVA